MRKWIGALLFTLILLALCGCKKESAETMTYAEETGDAGFRRTVLYYGTEDGFVVPVMRRVPWEEGIGKAALSYLVDTAENRRAADARGLHPLIPDGTRIALRIDESANAAVTLSGVGAMEEGARQDMVAAIVNTLTEFPAIKTVSVSADGTALKERSAALALNAEDGAVATASTGELSAMTLYFPNESASLNVPVTRYTESAPTFDAAVQALLDGPGAKGLRGCFPEGTALLSAAIEEGVARVDLSAAYAAVEETDGLALACYDTLYLTACAYAQELRALEISVEGKPFEIAAAVSAPLYVNEF